MASPESPVREETAHYDYRGGAMKNDVFASDLSAGWQDANTRLGTPCDGLTTGLAPKTVARMLS